MALGVFGDQNLGRTRMESAIRLTVAERIVLLADLEETLGTTQKKTGGESGRL
jgi:hypothetical protein